MKIRKYIFTTLIILSIGALSLSCSKKRAVGNVTDFSDNPVLTDITVPATDTDLAKDSVPATETDLAKDSVPANDTDLAKDSVPATETDLTKDSVPATDTDLTKDSVPATDTDLTENSDIADDTTFADDDPTLADDDPTQKKYDLLNLYNDEFFNEYLNSKGTYLDELDFDDFSIDMNTGEVLFSKDNDLVEFPYIVMRVPGEGDEHITLRHALAKVTKDGEVIRYNHISSGEVPFKYNTFDRSSIDKAIEFCGEANTDNHVTSANADFFDHASVYSYNYNVYESEDDPESCEGICTYILGPNNIVLYTIDGWWWCYTSGGGFQYYRITDANGDVVYYYDSLSNIPTASGIETEALYEYALSLRESLSTEQQEYEEDGKTYNLSPIKKTYDEIILPPPVLEDELYSDTIPAAKLTVGYELSQWHVYPYIELTIGDETVLQEQMFSET